MLKLRLYTAIVLIPLVVLAILKLPTNIIQFFIGAVVLIAGWEWMNVVGIHIRSQRIAGLVGLVSVYLLALVSLSITTILVIALTVWTLATVMVIAFAHRPLPPKLAALFTQKWFGYLMALFILIPFTLTALLLHAATAQGPELLLYVLVTVWLA